MTHELRLSSAMLLLALAACGGSATSSSPNGPSVRAKSSLAFTPAVLTATAGVPVSFVFESVGHTVVFDAVTGKPEDITATTSNKTVVRTFNTPGDFPYRCTIHPSMTGSIHVTPAPVTGGY